MKDLPGLHTVTSDWPDVTAVLNVLRYVREGQSVALYGGDMKVIGVIVPIDQYRKLVPDEGS